MTCLLITSMFSIILFASPSPAQEGGEEETYSISLVQTAEVDKKIHEIEDRKVLTETYTVKRGDHLWKVFRDRGLLKKRNLMDLLSVLKKLNSSLDNLDLIHPGEKIVIPLKISPMTGMPVPAEKSPPVTIPLETANDLDLENYTIKRGDNLVKIVKELYDIPEKDLYNEYLNLLKRVNPSIKDLNFVIPGQIIKLPIYSPQTVRLPLKHSTSESELAHGAQKEVLKQVGRQLGEIFTRIGEEWVQTGEHFIPLKSGGQINLKADSYPIVNLSSGNRVIVDLYSDLPQKMAMLIKSSWNNYRVVHLEEGDDLRKAMDKIIQQCDFHKVYRSGEPLKIGGDIPLRITADWIIKPHPEQSGEKRKIMVVTLINDTSPRIPDTIKTFLEGLGITVIDYPPSKETRDDTTVGDKALEAVNEKSSLIEMLLGLAGKSYSKNVKIPVYQSQKADFSLMIRADFFLNIDGRDGIIDLSGFGPDIITLLKEHQFFVLPLFNEEDASVVTTKTLNFLGVEFDSKPHQFYGADRDESTNVRLSISGIVFRDNEDKRVFATPLKLPQELMSFLAGKGYSILLLSLP